MIKELIISMFGHYTPVYTELNGVYTIPSGASGIDWPWLSGVIIFCLLLFLVITFIRLVFRR